MRYRTCRTASKRCARSSAVGSWNGIPDFLMLCLARLIRWAIVASGTRNAWAISAVVKPPTARNVSATAEAGVNAGWQHMKRRTSVSSSCGAVSNAVQRGDTSFQVILAQFGSHRGFFQEMESSPNQISVPFGTVLDFQLDQAATVVHPARKTRRVETFILSLRLNVPRFPTP